MLLLALVSGFTANLHPHAFCAHAADHVSHAWHTHESHAHSAHQAVDDVEAAVQDAVVTDFRYPESAGHSDVSLSDCCVGHANARLPDAVAIYPQVGKPVFEAFAELGMTPGLITSMERPPCGATIL